MIRLPVSSLFASKNKNQTSDISASSFSGKKELPDNLPDNSGQKNKTALQDSGGETAENSFEPQETRNNPFSLGLVGVGQNSLDDNLSDERPDVFPNVSVDEWNAFWDGTDGYFNAADFNHSGFKTGKLYSDHSKDPGKFENADGLSSLDGIEAVNDPDDELLVAYLDRELSEEEADSVEKRLQTDDFFRARFEELKQSSELLDSLEKIPMNPQLAQSTLEMLAVESEKEGVQTRRKLQWRTLTRWSFGLLLCFLSLVGGRWFVSAFYPSRLTQIQRDLNVIAYLDELQLIENIEFLNQLLDSSLFRDAELAVLPGITEEMLSESNKREIQNRKNEIDVYNIQNRQDKQNEQNKQEEQKEQNKSDNLSRLSGSSEKTISDKTISDKKTTDEILSGADNSRNEKRLDVSPVKMPDVRELLKNRRFYSQQQKFYTLPEEEQEHLRTLYAQIGAKDNGTEAFDVIDNYYAWYCQSLHETERNRLEKMPSEQRFETVVSLYKTVQKRTAEQMAFENKDSNRKKTLRSPIREKLPTPLQNETFAETKIIPELWRTLDQQRTRNFNSPGFRRSRTPGQGNSSAPFSGSSSDRAEPQNAYPFTFKNETDISASESLEQQKKKDTFSKLPSVMPFSISPVQKKGTNASMPELNQMENQSDVQTRFDSMFFGHSLFDPNSEEKRSENSDWEAARRDKTNLQTLFVPQNIQSASEEKIKRPADSKSTDDSKPTDNLRSEGNSKLAFSSVSSDGPDSKGQNIPLDPGNVRDNRRRTEGTRDNFAAEFQEHPERGFRSENPDVRLPQNRRFSGEFGTNHFESGDFANNEQRNNEPRDKEQRNVSERKSGSDIGFESNLYGGFGGRRGGIGSDRGFGNTGSGNNGSGNRGYGNGLGGGGEFFGWGRLVPEYVSKKTASFFLPYLSEKGRQYIEKLEKKEMQEWYIALILLADLSEMPMGRMGGNGLGAPQKDEPFIFDKKGGKFIPAEKNYSADAILEPIPGLADFLKSLPEDQKDELLNLPSEEMYARLLVLYWGIERQNIRQPLPYSHFDVNFFGGFPPDNRNFSGNSNDYFFGPQNDRFQGNPNDRFQGNPNDKFQSNPYYWRNPVRSGEGMPLDLVPLNSSPWDSMPLNRTPSDPDSSASNDLMPLKI